MKRLEKMGSYPSGQRGLTVNQLSVDFGGSNPSLPTWKSNRLIVYRLIVQQETIRLVTIRLPALIAQSVEHVLGKNGVMGSNPIEGFVT